MKWAFTLLFLMGCSSILYERTYILPNGDRAYVIDCCEASRSYHETKECPRNMADCYDKAGHICKRGYSTESDDRILVSQNDNQVWAVKLTVVCR